MKTPMKVYVCERGHVDTSTLRNVCWQCFPTGRGPATQQVVEVVPADSPQVLSVEEARLLDRANREPAPRSAKEHRQFEALLDRLASFAEEANRG